MPTFRYEAAVSLGVPVHGTVDAADEADLATLLQNRGLKLVSATELSLDTRVGSRLPDLPRLFQLRVGEALREAFLTELPAHEAVRAIAAEPFSHPLLSVLPWFQVLATLVFGGILVEAVLTGTVGNAVWVGGLICCVLMPLVWGVAVVEFSVRPRSVLRRLADQLEAGTSDTRSLQAALPQELRTIMQSQVPQHEKVRTVSELIPTLMSSGLRNQQFAFFVLGPLVMLTAVLLCFYAMLAFVVPDFQKIFEDFGMELPYVTIALIDLSRLVSQGGAFGWAVTATAALALLLGLFLLLTTDLAAEALDRVPMIGVGFRWKMQSRVARILAAMLRNDCDYAESLRTATAGSGYAKVREEGLLLAGELEKGSPTPGRSEKLGGLPISMLFVHERGTESAERRRIVASTFDNLADMLQNATASQGRLLAMLLHFLVLVFSVVVIGLGVLAMFLPIIKLLDALA